MPPEVINKLTLKRASKNAKSVFFMGGGTDTVKINLTIHKVRSNLWLLLFKTYVWELSENVGSLTQHKRKTESVTVTRYLQNEECVKEIVPVKIILTREIVY